MESSRIELGAGAWLHYERQWLDRARAQALFEQLRAGIAWEQREIVLFGRRILQPREIAWAGELPYRYSGQTLPVRPAIPLVRALIDEVSTQVGVSFNHVLLNHYRDGADSMGLHADDEAELGADPVLASLSLGCARRFVVVPKRRSSARRLALHLESGSLLVMGGTFQRHYRHGVPKEPNVVDARINLTFRRLLRPPAT